MTKKNSLLRLGILALLISAYFVNHGYGFDILINELNTDNPELDTKEFIELKVVNIAQGETVDIRGYFVALLRAYGQLTKSAEITLFGNLQNTPLARGQRYIVIGDDAVTPTPDLKSSDPLFSARRKYLHGSGSLFSLMTNGNKFPHACLLLYGAELSDRKIIREKLVLSKQRPTVRVTDELNVLLKKYLKDMVVYARRAPTDRCSIFELFVPSYKDNHYVLREWDTSSHPDRSLNRCTATTDPFTPQYFKLGNPTPKADNDCTAASFWLENLIPSYVPPVPVDVQDVSPSRYGDQSAADAIEHSCVGSSAVDEQYWQLRSERDVEVRMVEAMTQQAPMQCPASTSTEGDEVVLEVERRKRVAEQVQAEGVAIPEKARKKLEGLSPTPVWLDESNFQTTWLSQMDRNQPKLMSSKWFTGSHTDRRAWFEYLPNLQSPVNSRYRCRLCYQHYNKFKLDPRYKTLFAQEDGVLRRSKDANRDELAGHAKSTGHLAIVDKLKEAAKGSVSMTMEEVQQVLDSESDGGIYRVTANMLRTVYMEVQANIPFNQHKAVTDLLKLNGASMGYHHADRTSATRMTLLMSDEMHKSLVKHLTSANIGPLAIILDASTDFKGHHYLITYFQALEQNDPRCFFYRLIELGADETAQGYLEALLAAFQVDGLERSLKSNLLGFASDGASVMLGKNNGLLEKLKTHFDKPIYGIHCMAHRLQLATGHAWNGLAYFSRLERLANSIYNFYNARGHKHKAHLRNTIAALKETFFEFNYIFKVRWLASEFQALLNIEKSWQGLVTDLNEIALDPQSSDTAKATAKGILKRLQSRRFMLLLQFILDILNALQSYSRSLQGQLGTLVGMEQQRFGYIQLIQKSATSDGKFLVKFLSNIYCGPDVEHLQKACTADQVESSIVVRYFDFELKKHSDEPILSTARQEMTTKLEAKLSEYFPEGSLSNFDIFGPSKMPTTTAEALHYGQASISALSTKFGLSVADCLDQWEDLLASMISLDGYECDRKRSVVDFWSNYLNKQGLLWGECIKKLVQGVMVIPLGSAEAERGFSILKHVKYDRRSRLATKSLESILRLRINGQSDISKFDAIYYAVKWHKTKHILTDSKQQLYNPKAGMTGAEVQFDEAFNNIFDLEARGKTTSTKSNLF